MLSRFIPLVLFSSINIYLCQSKQLGNTQLSKHTGKKFFDLQM